MKRWKMRDAVWRIAATAAVWVLVAALAPAATAQETLSSSQREQILARFDAVRTALNNAEAELRAVDGDAFDIDASVDVIRKALEASRARNAKPAIAVVLSVDEDAAATAEEGVLSSEVLCLAGPSCAEIDPDEPPLVTAERAAPGRIVGFDNLSVVALETNSICLYGWQNGRRVIAVEFPPGACSN